MKNDIDTTLLGTGSIIKKGYRMIAENVGKAIALITGAITVLVSFTEIGFHDFGTQQLTANLVLILVSSYIIFFSMEDAGERLGRESEAYTAKEREYLDTVAELGSDITGLADFLCRYTQRELEQRRQYLLARENCSVKDYEDFLLGVKFDKKKTSVMKKARSLSPISLSAETLLCKNATAAQPLRNPERWKTLRLFLSMLPSTLCTIFTVSVMLSAREGLTPEVVIESLLKLSCLPIIALRGYSSGYSHATEEQVAWLGTKTRLIRAYLDEKKHK